LLGPEAPKRVLFQRIRYDQQFAPIPAAELILTYIAARPDNMDLSHSCILEESGLRKKGDRIRKDGIRHPRNGRSGEEFFALLRIQSRQIVAFQPVGPGTGNFSPARSLRVEKILASRQRLAMAPV